MQKPLYDQMILSSPLIQCYCTSPYLAACNILNFGIAIKIQAHEHTRNTYMVLHLLLGKGLRIFETIF